MGEEEKEIARSNLFDLVEARPDHVQAVCLLAVIGLADSNEDIIDAVTEALEDLEKNSAVSDVDKLRVSQVLAGIRAKQPAESQEKVRQATASIALAPGQPQGWLALFEATGNETAAELAKGSLEAADVASVFAGIGSAEEIQLAKVLAPWK